jgi:hypothetical protein
LSRIVGQIRSEIPRFHISNKIFQILVVIAKNGPNS